MLKIIILAALLAGCAKAGYSDRPAPDNPRAEGSNPQLRVSAMQLWIDKETGCHYLVPLGYTSTDSGITPRIAADGKTHMGCGAIK